MAGGGPAGLATAIAARRRGLSVIVADGALPPVDKPCGEGLMPDGVNALHQLGIAIPEDQAYAFRGIRFLSGGIKAEATFPRGTAYGIRRTHLHRLMLEQAAACGVRTLWQSSVTGLHPEGALIAGELVRARWVVGADGAGSRVRRWSKLDRRKLFSPRESSLRFAFRRHYRIAPWTDFMELHWGNRCQVYVTPVSSDEVCVVLISSHPDPRLHIEDALGQFPELAERLMNAEFASGERGAITMTRRLRRLHRGRTVLVGDASGGVDAITGQGLCLAFQQAALLGDCLASGDFSRYEARHRELVRHPALMARMMLLMAKYRGLRLRVMRMFQANPDSFGKLLAMHVGGCSPRQYLSNGIALGYELLNA